MLPIELWRAVLEYAFAECELPKLDANEDIIQLEPFPYGGIDPSVSPYPQKCKISFVCRLWREISEEFIYRHLVAHDIDSLHSLKMLITLPAYTRVHTISTNDQNHRRRGIWAHSLTFKDSGRMPISTLRGYSFRIEKCILDIIQFLPNLRLLSIHGVETVTGLVPKSLLQRLPNTLIGLSFVDAPFEVNFRNVPPRLREKLHFFGRGEIEGWSSPGPLSSSQLRCLSIDAYVVDCNSWSIPNLAFLIITRRKERIDDSWIIFLQKVGKALLRLEMINNTALPWILDILDTRFLRWCTQLHTLALDLLRFSILPGSSSDCPSIKRLVLVVRREDDSRDLVTKILLALHSISKWINECLTHLSEVILSVPWGFSSSGKMGLHVPYEEVVKVVANHAVRIAYY
jgi:hypothetical protein